MKKLRQRQNTVIKSTKCYSMETQDHFRLGVRLKRSVRLDVKKVLLHAAYQFARHYYQMVSLAGYLYHKQDFTS